MNTLIEAAHAALLEIPSLERWKAECYGLNAEILGDLAEEHGFTVEDADDLLCLAGSKSRGRLLMRLESSMRLDDWMRLVCNNWTACDDLAAVRNEMAEIFANMPPKCLRLTMTPKERKALRALPEAITVYRGCYEHNRDGLSWSLSKAIAEEFVTKNRYRHDDKQALLLIGSVNRDRVFLKLDREELEIVSANVAVASVVEVPRVAVAVSANE